MKLSTKRISEKLKTFNNYIYTQIRIDKKLRQQIRIVCAAEGINTRKELCEKSLEQYIKNPKGMLIAPAKNGILFRVELPKEYDGLIEREAVDRDTNMSRIFHTALYSYIQSFKLNNPELAKQLIKIT